MARGNSHIPDLRPSRAPSVSAAVAAATENADSVSSYKRKLFFRRLKVVLMVLIALTLLLLGCLLGFVIPASLEVKGQERGNITNQERKNFTSRVNDSVFTTSMASNEPNLTTEIPTSTVKEAMTTTEFYPTKDKRISYKWWLPKLPDAVSEAKNKFLLTSTLSTSKPVEATLRYGVDTKRKFTQQTTETSSIERATDSKTAEMITYGEALESNGTTMPSISNSITKRNWWKIDLPRNPPNQLQKTDTHNDTVRATMVTAAFFRANDGRRVQQRFDRSTTVSSWEDSKNQLLRNNGNQTSRPNVRRVTSYPKQNLTVTGPTTGPTTGPSVVTRFV